MVNTRFHYVRLTTPIIDPAEKSSARGRGRGRGRGRIRGRGRGRVSPARGVAPIENTSRNENPHMHHEEIKIMSSLRMMRMLDKRKKCRLRL